MNEITTSTAHDLSLEQCDELLIQGICNIRDAVLGYTLHGLTQTQISDRVKGLGLKGSVRTIKRHVADLRDEGLLPAVEPGTSLRTEQRRRKAETTRGQNGPMSPTPTIQPEPTSNVIPFHPAPTPQQHCVPTDDPSTVIFPEVVPISTGELDFDRAEQLLQELIALSKANFATGGKHWGATAGWTQLQWNTIGGYCRTIADCCDARGGRKSSAAKQPVPSAPAFAHSSD
jgi:hypothetical protein